MDILALFASFKEFICEIGYNRGQLLDIPACGIDNQIVKGGVTPFVSRDELRIASAVFVNTSNVSFDRFFGKLLAFVCAF